MAKYTREELQEMAMTVVSAEHAGDPRAIVLYIKIYRLTRMDPAEVRERIYALAGEPLDVTA